MAKIKKGDTVKIITGKDRNKTGKVIKVFPKENKITIEGVNIYKKHVRPKRQGEKGEIINITRPLHISNVSLICSHCSKNARIGFIMENKKKIRICKRCKGFV